MIRTLGKMPTTMPPGYFKAIEFPTLALLDKQTGDHRLLTSGGADSRELPLSIRFARQASYGHEGASVSGTLFEVTIDPEAGKMSGRGFLLNDEFGREHARLVYLQAMRGNSVDLADVKARLVEDFETGEAWIEFTQFRLAATTGVATPAFGEASAVITDGMSEDELVAALVGDDAMTPLVVDASDFYVHTQGFAEEIEVVASGAIIPAFDDFYVPEADKPTKSIVTAEGLVYGHLAQWNTCHDGYQDHCMTVPRPRDGYASFNKPGVLTTRGQVQTGPIFALGGHRSAKSAPTIEQAYGGIENAWADVRVVEGKFGPWLSGRVRPGVSEETIYAVRASRISGHWVNGALKAIVSVNAEGFDVPGDPALELVADIGYALSDDMLEVFASLPACAEDQDPNQMTLTFHLPENVDAEALADAIASVLGEAAGEATEEAADKKPPRPKPIPRDPGKGRKRPPFRPPPRHEAADEQEDEVTDDELLAELLDDERDEMS